MPESFFPEGMLLPEPMPDGTDAGFWEACRRHDLVAQRCSDCGVFRHPPEVVCYNCRSFNSRWEKLSGRGTVYSHMNVTYPAHPALAEAVPYNVVSVELADAPGIKMVGNVVDCPYEEIRIGMAVEVHWEDHPEKNIAVPRWRRAD